MCPVKINCTFQFSLVRTVLRGIYSSELKKEDTFWFSGRHMYKMMGWIKTELSSRGPCVIGQVSPCNKRWWNIQDVVPCRRKATGSLRICPCRQYWDPQCHLLFVSKAHSPWGEQASNTTCFPAWCTMLPQAQNNMTKWPWTVTSEFSESVSQNKPFSKLVVAGCPS